MLLPCRGILERRLSKNEHNWKPRVPLLACSHTADTLLPSLFFTWGLTWPRLAPTASGAFDCSSSTSSSLHYSNLQPLTTLAVYSFSFCQLPGFQMIHFCCPIFQISIHTYNLYSTDWGHYGDTTESAFLLKDLSCYTLTPTLRNQRWSVLYL